MPVAKSRINGSTTWVRLPLRVFVIGQKGPVFHATGADAFHQRLLSFHPGILIVSRHGKKVTLRSVGLVILPLKSSELFPSGFCLTGPSCAPDF